MALAVWAVAQTTAAPRMDKVMPAILPPPHISSNPLAIACFSRWMQSTVDASAQAALNAQADWLIANPDYKVIIEGHADERGTRDYNLALGARRAGSVREYLTLRGVSADRIQTVSYGKERPSELCSAESCYAMNRRGVTVLSNLSF